MNSGLCAAAVQHGTAMLRQHGGRRAAGQLRACVQSWKTSASYSDSWAAPEAPRGESQLAWAAMHSPQRLPPTASCAPRLLI
jgi:hypothetical protein